METCNNNGYNHVYIISTRELFMSDTLKAFILLKLHCTSQTRVYE